MTIEDLGANMDSSKRKKIDMILRQVESLPTLPVVATKLFQTVTAEDVSIKEIVELIEADQSLTAKILSLTRKAYLGLGSNIDTVEKAVLMLGFEAVRNAVLSIQVFEAFAGSEGEKEQLLYFDRKELWKHSLAVACAGQLIAEFLGPRCKYEPNEVFVCGLLHDIGKVAFDAILPKSFARIVQIAESNRISIADVERRILGIDHSIAGKKLAEHWKLPTKIVNVVWLHHHRGDTIPDDIEHKDLIEVIYIADIIAREQRIGFSGNFILNENSEELCKRIGIDKNQYDEILLRLREHIGQKASLLGLDEVTSERLYQQALRDANKELGKLNEELTFIRKEFDITTRYVQAIEKMNQKLAGEVSLTNVLSEVAEIVRFAFDVPSLVLFVQSKKGKYIESVITGEKETKLFELLREEHLEEIAELFVKPAPYLADMLKVYMPKLGPFPPKMIPLMVDREMIGGIIVAVNPKSLLRLSSEKKQVSLLVQMCKVILVQGLILEEKNQFIEELVGINQRMQELEGKLAEAKSIITIEELSAGAAHELNNPLAVISGRAQLLLSKTEDEEVRESLELIIKQCNKVSEIVSLLMEFAKPIVAEREKIELKSFIEEIVSRFVELHQLNPAQIITDIFAEADTVYCDKVQLESVIMEVLKNAREAIDNKEQLKIEISTVNDVEEVNTIIRIKDNGPGMSYDTLRRAINPFFSEKKAGRKRGLGLSLAYRYVQANGGELWIDSLPGKGTTVLIKLPKSEFKDTTEKCNVENGL